MQLAYCQRQRNTSDIKPDRVCGWPSFCSAIMSPGLYGRMHWSRTKSSLIRCMVHSRCRPFPDRSCDHLSVSLSDSV